MSYDVTLPGRHGSRVVFATASTMAQARQIAQQEADSRNGPVYIERVTARGNSKHVATVRPSRSNPGGRVLTKLQKRVVSAKKAADRRVAVALAKYLRQENPGRKVVGAKKTRGKGGRITIIPIFGRKVKK